MAKTIEQSARPTPDLVKYPWAVGLQWLGPNLRIASNLVLNPGYHGESEDIDVRRDPDKLPLAELVSRDMWGKRMRLAYILGYSGECEVFDSAKLARDTEQANKEARERGSSGYVSIERVDNSYNLFFVEGALNVSCAPDFFGCRKGQIHSMKFTEILSYSALENCS